MKKPYTPPTLTVHGTVEEITQAFGGGSAQDTIYYGRMSFPGNGGSQDGVVIPGRP